MNKVILTGRLTKDPEVRYLQGDDSICVARFTLAVDRYGKKQNGQQTADFIPCEVWRNQAEAVGKYLHKGMKICVEGHIKTGSYTDRDGRKVYTTDVVVNSWEFCESKKFQETQPEPEPTPEGDEFMQIPEGVQEDLPFI